ncbi:M20 aminoacylase family protein [Kiloniella sp. b19]|uniref:M20 aminoacylase family protein n=1 Tax=Kiloniella sp. GXU_MW_B19 TaxID=3141326 RepID=UPI0031E2C592
MPILNRVADLHADITAWRQDIHSNPELDYDLPRTSEKVRSLLESFGVDEIHTGIGKIGVVGLIHGRTRDSGRVVGLRADMDALPIKEATGKAYASTVEGKMHACGHDGHTSMLLGAARYLSETRDFDGTVAVIFQPAEEGGGGGKAMVDDGMMDRFGIQQVYGMHNMPGMPVGQFGIRPGGFMASADEFQINITGKGGHAAMPHTTIDPIIVGSQIVSALQSIVARNVDPLKSGVLSVTQFHAGDAHNVIPQTAFVGGTVRALDEEVRLFIKRRIGEVAEQTAALFGATADYEYKDGYPVTANHSAETVIAADIAAEVVGEDNVDRDHPPLMGAEDFSYMLLERPGAFIFMGNGETAGLHHPEYDFNDEAIPVGVSYWATLVSKLMPAAK